ncbi:predicted protein [Botrytis cinerea T4]|uniref:Uncharacterized protein n=1 Tax=Botryotinia fuckeliana (strain T4) TaxID=999810 RepID=G2XRC5_BOTF4|nr:predicted protein [Botrytis cinerea T4]
MSMISVRAAAKRLERSTTLLPILMSDHFTDISLGVQPLYAL